MKIESNSIVPAKILSDIAGRIEFRKVCFRYPGTDHKALDYVDLKVRAGEHIAIVGPSGSGKSTITSLLERFYEPVLGGILVGGPNILNIDLRNYRSFLAMVR